MRTSHALAALALIIGSAATLPAQGMMQAAPSGRGTTAVTLVFADSAARAAAQPATVRIDYGQPHLRGRSLHTDSLVPYDQMWRTGANAPTLLTTDVDLTLGGANIPRGSYVLQTLPTSTGWTLIVQQPPVALPAGMPVPATPVPPVEVARIPLRQSALPMPVESLSFWLVPSTQPGGAQGELRLAWGPVMLATDWAVR